MIDLLQKLNLLMMATTISTPLLSGEKATQRKAPPLITQVLSNIPFRMLLFLLLLISTACFTANAAIIPVTNGNDAGPGSLRQAIATAADLDVIQFVGVSTVTLTSGELIISKRIAVNGGAGVTITRSGTTAFRLLTVASGFAVTINNITFTNGKADLGGAIYNNSNFLLLESCTFSGNKATVMGGALYNNASSPKVTNSLFFNNAIEVAPPPCSAPTGLAATNITSTAATLSWNAVPNATHYVITLMRLSYNPGFPTTVEGSSTHDAGTGTSLTIGTLVSCRRHNWFVTAYCGSGAGNSSIETQFITTGCTGGGGGGGGIQRVNTAKPVLKVGSPNFHNNERAGHQIEINSPINSITSTENSVTGGAAIANNGGSAQVINCTFYSNTATTGGTILNVATTAPVITNAIIWGNSAGGIVNTASAAAVTYSIVQGGYAGTGNLNADPLFVDAAAGNFQLQACSPAVNAGNNDVDFNPPVLPASCGAPTGLATTGITNTAATFSWTGVTGAANYVITLTRSSTNSTPASTSTYNVGANTTFTITPLSGCSQYSWIVTAFCTSGANSASTVSSFVTTGCGSGGQFSKNSASQVSIPQTSNNILETTAPQTNSVINTSTTDLAGNPRIVNNIIDMGAYELQSGCCSLTTFYKDADNDNYSDGSLQEACTQPFGYKLASALTATTGDCNDAVAAINPGATEICDGIDNNCNGTIDEGFPEITYFRDADGDGFGSPNVGTIAKCGAPAGFVANNSDCNDAAAAINPAATELCDGIDNNCNGTIDEGFPEITYFRDADGDGFGSPNVGTIAKCGAPAGFVTNNSDCNDAAAAINPAATELCDGIDNDCDGLIDEGVKITFYKDADNDGYSDGTTQQACTQPTGYKLASALTATTGDCNDAVAAINPGATEICDGIDNNCNGQIDEGVRITFYRDADNDSYGNVTITIQACTAPSGYVTNSTDCNDANAAINPAATELCDGVDNNCNGTVDEGFPNIIYYRDVDGDSYGNSLVTATAKCSAPVGYVTNSTDCNDANAAINPAATELCDGVDNNCNGTVDEGFPNIIYYRDADRDSYGNSLVTTTAKCGAPAGYVTNNTDCNDANAAINPGATEVCDGIDNDCDGLIDEGVKLTFYRDADGDGFGNPALLILACVAPAGYVSNNTDCRDNDPAISPAAVEVCGNRIDDNCNGLVDEAICFPCLNATNLTTTNITSTSAQFNWTAVANPEQWQVRYKTTNLGSQWVEVLLTGNRRTVTIQGLLPDQNYQWQIRARCKNWTDNSATLNFRTLSISGRGTFENEITQTQKTVTADKALQAKNTSVALDALQVEVLPNPSPSYFTLLIKSNSKLPVTLRVVNVVGILVEGKSGLAANSTLRVGDNYRPGVYFAQIRQGNKTTTIKLIKQML